MQIEVSFHSSNPGWEGFIVENAHTAASVLSDPEFLARVRGWSGFDFTDKTPAEIADTLQAADVVTVTVGFYNHVLGPSIAKEDPNTGSVSFNTAKRSRGAGSPGNVAHETMHVLGFSHNGNQIAGNENTVPYRIGQWVDEALTGPAAHARE